MTGLLKIVEFHDSDDEDGEWRMRIMMMTNIKHYDFFRVCPISNELRWQTGPVLCISNVRGGHATLGRSSQRYEISYSARQWYCRALGKILKGWDITLGWRHMKGM